MQDQLKIQIKNTEKALEVLKAAPEDRIDLLDYARITECGTMFCALGWIARVPYFVAQGMSIATDDEHVSSLRNNVFVPRMNGLYLSSTAGGRLLNNMFGDLYQGDSQQAEGAWLLLFSARRDSPYDADFSFGTRWGSDKEFAVNRFRRHLENLKELLVRSVCYAD